MYIRLTKQVRFTIFSERVAKMKIELHYQFVKMIEWCKVIYSEPRWCVVSVVVFCLKSVPVSQDRYLSVARAGWVVVSGSAGMSQHYTSLLTPHSTTQYYRDGVTNNIATLWRAWRWTTLRSSSSWERWTLWRRGGRDQRSSSRQGGLTRASTQTRWGRNNGPNQSAGDIEFCPYRKTWWRAMGMLMDGTTTTTITDNNLNLHPIKKTFPHSLSSNNRSPATWQNISHLARKFWKEPNCYPLKTVILSDDTQHSYFMIFFYF